MSSLSSFNSLNNKYDELNDERSLSEPDVNPNEKVTASLLFDQVIRENGKIKYVICNLCQVFSILDS